MARRIRVDPRSPDPAAIEAAADVLRAGGLVAFPTETVYGLGANAMDVGAVNRIYAAKGRPGFNPLIVHVPDARAAESLAAEWPGFAAELAQAFWPGPLTLVVMKAEALSPIVTAGLPTVGLRVPAHPVAQAILRATRFPVAAPSANPSMAVSPTTGEHVAHSLGERVDLVLDSGPTPIGIESAVVDVSGSAPVLLRPGTIAREHLASVVGPLLDAGYHAGDTPRPSPGMLRRHYAPNARVQLFAPEQVHIARAHVEQARSRGERVGAMIHGGYELGTDVLISMPHDPSGYAHRLYAALHELEHAGCALIMIERVPGDSQWSAIRDRLARAAAES